MIMLILLFFVTPSFSRTTNEAIGWHWYNEIQVPETKTVDKENTENKKEAAQISAVAKLAKIRELIEEAKAKAILYPTEENVRSYIVLQNFIVSKADVFSRVWKKTQLDYPELDYSIMHPVQNAAQSIVNDETYHKEEAAIRILGQQYGLLFFYRGDNPLDQAVAPIIQNFCLTHNIALIPITMDGKVLLPNSRINNNQAEKLGVKFFPALILVDPKTNLSKPLSYGFVAESDLRRRFLRLATNFKEGI